ncbi:MAG: diguanylate cyclase [Synergistaceae bacterium]
MVKFKNSIVVTIFAVVLSVASVLCILVYQKEAAGRAEQSAYRILRDSARGQAVLFDMILKEQFDALKIISGTLEAERDISPRNLKSKLRVISLSTHYRRVMVAGADGTAYSGDGSAADVSSYQCYKSSMLGRPSMENVSSRSFLLSLPIVYDGVVKGAVMCEYDKSLLRKTFMSEAFGTESYSFVCDKKGDIVVQTIHVSSLNNGGNIFEFFRKSALLNGASLSSLQNDFSNGTEGIVSYQFDGKQRYAIYHPLGLKGWFIFNAVPQDIIESEVSYLTKSGAKVAFAISLISFLFVFIIIVLERRTVKIIKEEHKRTQESNEKFRVAMQSMGATTWDYDLKAHEIIPTEESNELHGFTSSVKNVPNSLIDSGYVHPDSAEEFRAMYARLFAGVPYAEGVFRMRRPDGKGWWYEHIRYINQYTLDGDPYCAIGIGQDVTDKQNLMTAAQTDLLTDVLNHNSAIDKISSLIDSLDTDGICALFMVDVDHFKSVNDTLGHQCGDSVLMCTAKNIKDLFRAGDVVGRVGGDEFLAFVHSVPDIAIIRRKAEMIVSSVHSGCRSTLEISVFVSVGVAILNQGESFEELYKHADTALYEAKKEGRNRFVFYSQSDEECNV